MASINTDLHITIERNRLAKSDYSAIQRQKLLAIVVNEGVVDRDEILSHLQYLVNRSERRANMKMACVKWREDNLFLQEKV